MQGFGYPSFVLYLILLIGMPLALKKPFKAFLLVAFMLSSSDANAFTFTRSDLLGSYFNANDACLLIALLAMIPYMRSRVQKIYCPKVAQWLIAVLLVGFVQSWVVLGWTYEVLRALRWAINLPVFFIIAATLVDKKEKVRPLITALLLGAVVAAIQHLIFVQGRAETYGFDIDKIRTIAYVSLAPMFIVATIVWIPKIREREKVILMGACVLFIISTILNQTRSIWFSTIAALPVTLMLFKQKKIGEKIVYLPIVILLITGFMFFVVFFFYPEWTIYDLIMERLLSLTKSQVHTFTRLIAFEYEMEAWLNSNMIFGCGLFYFALQPYGFIAWGHLGHVTTLAQLGLVGLFVYSYYLPTTVIKTSRKLWRQLDDEVRFLGLLAGITIIWYWICFVMSNSFLGQHALPGIVFGAAWRQARLIRVKRRKLYTGDK